MSDVDCRAPGPLNPKRWLRCPHLKAHTSMPKVAPMVKMFITTAMSGSTTERVMAKSITSAISTISPRTTGRWDLRLFCSDKKEAVCPTTVSCPGPVQRLKLVDGPLGCR